MSIIITGKLVKAMQEQQKTIDSLQLTIDN